MATVPKKVAKPMTKAQLIAQLAEKVGIQKKVAAEVLDELAQIGYKEAKKGFTIPGFGKLVLVKRKARMGRNPQTGEPVKIPAKTVVKFRIAKACKDAVLGAKK
ncbi:MAG TPA: HU family DNA-binding protein [bacterium]|jgi:DNA-binding protein HU-beta|nr:HU family DNA-binding protein [bacterium]HQL63578.1 HU family DNA-binding protein [bacterium]